MDETEEVVFEGLELVNVKLWVMIDGTTNSNHTCRSRDLTDSEKKRYFPQLIPALTPYQTSDSIARTRMNNISKFYLQVLAVGTALLGHVPVDLVELVEHAQVGDIVHALNKNDEFMVK